jgi:hypothetical protein
MNNMHRDPLREFDMSREYLRSRARKVYPGSYDDGSVPLGGLYTLAFYAFIGSIVWGLIKVWWWL